METNFKVHPADVEALLKTSTVKTHHFEGTNLTVAAVITETGFVLATGESSCVDPKDFDAEIGEQIATEKALNKALDKAWKLLGYQSHIKMVNDHGYPH